MVSTDNGSAKVPPLSSRLMGSIGGMSRLRQSLLFAELSLLSYFDDYIVREVAAMIGVTTVRFFDREGAQAYLFASPHDCVVACRGTEPTDWNDLRADLSAGTVVAETVGRVHRGFKREVDDLWPALEDALSGTAKPIWFTGHSLGGAMATICAGRCEISTISASPMALFTYGCPRVGNRRYINDVRINHFRWVNNNDLVTRVPPTWFGYRHCGREIYLDYRGHVRQLSGWQRLQDRVRGLLAGLDRLQIDYFADHSITRYIEHISAALQREEKVQRAVHPLIRPRRRATASNVTASTVTALPRRQLTKKAA